jgi:hypothetical protein
MKSKPIYKLLLFICLIMASCNNSPKNSSQDYVAKVNNHKIFLTSIDSSIQQDVYKLRSDAIQRCIVKEILELEAIKYGISFDSLMYKEVFLKCKIPNESEIKQFITANPQYNGNKEKVNTILSNMKRQEMYKLFVDSLKIYHEIKNNLMPVYSKILKTKDLFGFELNKSQSDIEVILIASFDCMSCLESFDEFEKIVAKYTKSVKFKFLILTTNYGIDGRAMMAAENQNKAGDLFKRIIQNSGQIKDTNFYYQSSIQLKFSKKRFDEDIKNNNLLKPLLMSRDFLFAQGVNTTPSFTINGKLFEGELAMNHLEALIADELKNQKK